MFSGQRNNFALKVQNTQLYFTSSGILNMRVYFTYVIKSETEMMVNTD